ncbi:hypothetical protein LTR95_017432 [Oleoguttula sp. CCFEE 5521]
MAYSLASLANVNLPSTVQRLGFDDLSLELQWMIFDEYFKLHTGCIDAYVKEQKDPDRMDNDQEEVVQYHDATSKRHDLGPAALLLTSKYFLAAARPRVAVHFPILIKT